MQESLDAHVSRFAMKKGMKCKAILCSLGATHIPRSDGVPVCVATVAPKDAELLKILAEAGNVARQASSSGLRRTHSI